MKRSKMIGLMIVITMVVVGFVGIRLTQPAYAVMMDVNPSIEIVSNRLNHVVAVNPLNEDARELLKDFNLKDRELKDTVEDLADLMVLKGFISGGKDNLVMITVRDNEVKKEVVDNLNKAIAAYLDNKQIEATIVNQAIAKKLDDKTGKDIIAKRMSELDYDINIEQLSTMTLRELVDFAETRNIAPEKLFTKVLGNKQLISSKTEFISEAKAREIALGLVKGEIVKFELDDIDDDDDRPDYEIDIISNGAKYEIEIDAYTGKVLEFEKDDMDDDDDKRDDSKIKNAGPVQKKNNSSNKPATPTIKRQVIGEAKAKEIALGLVNGRVIELELDDDDDDLQYDIEILANGYKYEIEIDAFTGSVLEFEKDDDDFGDDFDDDEDRDDDEDDDKDDDRDDD